MTKEFLNGIWGEMEELKSLKRRLKKLEKQETRIVKDSVQASSKEFPFTQYTKKIEGVKVPKNSHLKNKYKKMIKNKEYKLDKKKIQLEYELNYIKDPEIRDIIRLRYNDGKTWLQIMFEKNYNSESKAKVKLKRFFEKNNKM